MVTERKILISNNFNAKTTIEYDVYRISLHSAEWQNTAMDHSAHWESEGLAVYSRFMQAVIHNSIINYVLPVRVL